MPEQLSQMMVVQCGNCMANGCFPVGFLKQGPHVVGTGPRTGCNRGSLCTAEKCGRAKEISNNIPSETRA